MKSAEPLKPEDYIETMDQEIYLHVDKRFHYLWKQIKEWALEGVAVEEFRNSLEGKVQVEN